MKSVSVIGAGRTGRGSFGEQFFSEGGFHITFADIDAPLIEELRSQGWYTVEMKDFISGASTTVRVEGFDVVNTVTERDAFINALACSTYVAVAVFPSSFPQIAKDLADMVETRRSLGMTAPVAVILGGNYVGLSEYFSQAMGDILAARGAAPLESNVALLTSRANRKVAFRDCVLYGRLPLVGDNKEVLLVDDRLPFGGGYDPPSFFQLGDAGRAMAEKIWSDNLVHCSLGFAAACKGYEIVNQAVEDDNVRMLAYRAWLEGRKALNAEYGTPFLDEEQTQEMFDKFASPFFHDKTTRVVRQPIRKLSRNDRFIGPALLCLRHGIIPYAISRAAALGFCFKDPAVPQSLEIAQRLEHDGVEETVAGVCGLDPSEQNDRIVLGLIIGAVYENSGIGKERFRPRCLEDAQERMVS